MPRLAVLDGIEIFMNTREKNHFLPHIHAYYNEEEISMDLNGNMNNKRAMLVSSWVILHREELEVRWNEYKSSR